MCKPMHRKAGSLPSTEWFLHSAYLDKQMQHLELQLPLLPKLSKDRSSTPARLILRIQITLPSSSSLHLEDLKVKVDDATVGGMKNLSAMEPVETHHA